MKDYIPAYTGYLDIYLQVFLRVDNYRLSLRDILAVYGYSQSEVIVCPGYGASYQQQYDH